VEKNFEYAQNLNSDGVVHYKGIFEKKDLLKVRSAIQAVIERPSPFGSHLQKDTSKGSFFMDFNNWKRIPEIYSVCSNPKLLKVVRTLTGSKSGWLFHDHELVKEGLSIATPWHHDRPYYIFKGNLNLSVWIPTTAVSRESSLLFWRGSHLFDELFMPKAFGNGKELENNGSYKSIGASDIPTSEIMDFDMEAGDAIIFYNNTLHASKPHSDPGKREALSVRLLLDGASMTKKYINATPPFDRMGVKVVEDGPIPSRFPKLW
jgi:ectoine hydroxylase-related dioxygenase (phytanoyl-CoA dioxygenase family)